MESYYKYLDYPYISKSSMYCFFSCKYKFKRRYLDKVEYPSNSKMDIGSFLHNIYDKFFEAVDYEVLWGLDWVSSHDSIYSQTYNYFMSVAYILLKLTDEAQIKKLVGMGYTQDEAHSRVKRKK